MRTPLAAFLGLLGTAVVVGQGPLSSPVNRPWPPGVLEVPPESPALSPADALQTFYMPPGYRLELVAAEPLVQDPTVMDFDLEGRIWVTEMTGFVRDLGAPEPNLDRIGRVVVLEDTNDDGRMDRRTVFADGLILPRAVKVLDRGVLVGEPGSLWWMRDTNGDLRADTKELVTNLYGRLHGSVEGNANSLLWGLDNWIHTANADVLLRYKDGQFEVRRTLMRGEWGATQDDAGRVYRNTNESALHVDFVPTPYYARHPTLLRTRGSYDALRDDENLVNLVWPVRTNPGTNRAYQVGIDRADGTLERFTAVCAPLVYRGHRLPAELYGNVFVAEPAANLVSRIVLEDNGATLTARKAYGVGEFLASTDERFRPVYLSNGPDGALYVVDMYRGIIQDRSSTTQYLRDYIVKKKLDAPIGMGRIYRVVHESIGREPRFSLAGATPEALVTVLSHPNGWRRDTAQRLIVERAGGLSPAARAKVVAALVDVARQAPDWRARIHALWTLDGIDAIEPDLVLSALGDRARDVRVAAIRIAERWLALASHPLQGAVIARTEDRDWAVRRQLAASLGALPAGPRETAIIALLEEHADDPVTMDAALSGLRGAEANALQAALARGTSETPQRQTILTMLAATIVRAAEESAVRSVLAPIGDAAQPAWQRSALLRGAEVALLGGAMPGTTPRRGGPPAAATAAPCPTCPGARGGPGGAYAFPGVREAQQAAASATSGGGRGGQVLRLNQEPAAITALAASEGDLSARLAKLLPRIEWPDKPGAAKPVAALTPAETARFEAGREVYRNACQSCHMPDGRGQERVAASLIGSEFAQGAPEVPIRILLSGKEGDIGLMPPLGSMLNDDDLAAVLTYVRREWGQTASPVDAALVGAVRRSTQGRPRPWTNDELRKLLEPAASPSP
jgi:mono/diheme cytochrome c family protein/glucose/arabinose dehydrogenase